jgi:hypothetical protein
MPHVGWLLRHGWYRIGLEEHWPALVLAAGWLVFAAVRRGSKSRSSPERKGVIASIIILIWLALACLHALGTTQLDLAGPTTRYPFFWDSIIVGGVVGLVTIACVILAERILTPAGSNTRVPRNIRLTVAFSGILWAGVWVWVFAREALLPSGG